MPNSSADPNLIPVDNPILGMIDAAAERYGVDRNLAHTVAQMESNYNPKAQSGAGAVGVMQLMPGTARDMGVNNIWDPAQNIDGGVKYLAQLSDRYSGDPQLVLAAYNAGPGAVDRAGGVPNYPETQNYVASGTRKLGSAGRAADLSADPNLTPVEATPARTQPSVEVLPPLSEPPGPAKSPEKTFKGFLDNATVGLGRILEPLTDPAGTLENVTNLLQEMSEKSGFAPVMGQPKAQVVDAIVNLYKHRYGSLEGFKNAWYDDPVGMAGDVAMVFSGAGLGKAAMGDFLDASGITQHAATIADTLPEAAAATAPGTAAETRIQAGIRGAVDALGKRYKEVAQAAIEKAPSGILGGPHGMLSTAKYGAARKAGQILKEGWQAGTAAYDAPAAAEAATAEIPAMTPGQALAKSQNQDWNALSANDQAMLEQIAKGQGNVAAQPGPPAQVLYSPGQPQAPPLTVKDLGNLVTGKSPSRLSDADLAQAAQARNVESAVQATVPTAAPPAAPAAPEAPPAAPEIPPVAETAITDADIKAWIDDGIQREMIFRDPTGTPRFDKTGNPITRDLIINAIKTERKYAVPPAAEAAASPRVSQVTEFLRKNYPDITPKDLEKFDALDWDILSRDAGVEAPSPEEISQIRSNIAEAAAPVPPEVSTAPVAEAEAAVTRARKARAPKKQPPATPAPGSPGEPPTLEQQLADSIRQAQERKAAAAAPVVQPGQTVAEALAAQAPPGPKSLAELMGGIGEQPELEKLDFAQVTRARNVDALEALMRRAGITPEMLDAEGDAGWAALAKKAKVGPKGKPYVPSEATRAQLRQRFAGPEEGPPPAAPAVPNEPTPPPQTPPAQAVSVQPTKEPWQMTRQEFLDTYPERTRAQIRKDVAQNVERLNGQIQSWQEALQKDPGNPALVSIRSAISEAESKITEQNARLTAPVPSPEQTWTPAQIRWHHVEYALREGKPVPSEVLAEYPELAKEFSSPAVKRRPRKQ